MTYVHPLFGIAMSEAQYADEWNENSRYFAENHLYDWMLEQLGSADLVLEVGCGSGASTSKIASSGKEILAIEVNKDAADAAVKNLTSAGHNAKILLPSDLPTWRPGGNEKVNILCADMFDEGIAAALPESTFDALLCWMTGSYPEHIATVLNKNYQSFEGSEMAAYRTKVQQRCYSVGARTLKQGGIVHVVDRAAMMSWNDKDELRKMLAEMQGENAGPSYQIGKGDTMFKRLDKPFNTSRIQYVAPSEASKAPVSALASSKARKV